ncbi:DNA ligase D [Salipaludibacillus sp. HK11]|uniref:DNA ligase D n=1 Tax=Salipaludibacillus sp. HK11 TaxID=3394320 RepID=UPI0039FC3B6E
MIKPMKLTAVEDFPVKTGWLYEAKYDGFRCLLVWEGKTPSLFSMSGRTLNRTFPEIIGFCEEMYESIKGYLPLTFDGELVYLENSFTSRFATVQRRSRMGQQSVIYTYSKTLPCHYVIFDLLRVEGTDTVDETLSKRKQRLKALSKKAKLPMSVNSSDPRCLQMIDSFRSFYKLWQNICLNEGEGAIAKRKSSRWKTGTRSTDWLKKKLWKFVTVVLTKFDPSNRYFTGAIYYQGTLANIVHFRHGFKEDEEKTLIALFQKNGTKTDNGSWELPASICVEVACIAFDGKHLREPRFSSFQLEVTPADCTWDTMHRQLMPFPDNVEVTSLDKPIWPSVAFTKDSYLLYLQMVAPQLLSHLKNRLLTLIRYPHGSGGEHFYQKNCPDYAPDFVKTAISDENEINYILCNDIETLLWLGNQLALEFHLPFETVDTSNPTEIVFDLDPPSRKAFPLAIDAALKMKAIFDELKLISFVKTSGRKGLQVYLPLPVNQFSYEETRRFTSFVCNFLCEQNPQSFTTERLKKNRGNRLYLDYIQHDKGKTIIAPYSPRGTEDGLVATPLYWEEVTDTLSPQQFSLPAVMERLKERGDPFRTLRQVDNRVALGRVLKQLDAVVKD